MTCGPASDEPILVSMDLVEEFSEKLPDGVSMYILWCKLLLRAFIFTLHIFFIVGNNFQWRKDLCILREESLGWDLWNPDRVVGIHVVVRQLQGWWSKKQEVWSSVRHSPAIAVVWVLSKSPWNKWRVTILSTLWKECEAANRVYSIKYSSLSIYHGHELSIEAFHQHGKLQEEKKPRNVRRGNNYDKVQLPRWWYVTTNNS